MCRKCDRNKSNFLERDEFRLALRMAGALDGVKASEVRTLEHPQAAHGTLGYTTSGDPPARKRVLSEDVHELVRLLFACKGQGDGVSDDGNLSVLAYQPRRHWPVAKVTPTLKRRFFPVPQQEASYSDFLFKKSDTKGEGRVTLDKWGELFSVEMAKRGINNRRQKIDVRASKSACQ